MSDITEASTRQAADKPLSPDIKRVLFTEEQIQEAVKRIGAEISRDYQGEHVLLLTVLKGAFIFMADLVRAIDGEVEIDFMAVSSYGAEAKTSGVVRIIKDLNVPVEGRHVVIVEDILDSGLTLKYLLKSIHSRKPATIEIATLLFKEGKQETHIDCKYIGLKCPDEFVVGYGLDYAERYRNLSYIGVLDEKVYA
ncbi:MAG: hypoxanthine phosphoribosyltransferase [Coriobacteriales bacterium]|jgi:hypoxanthine phosphoribosyltransferase|nr:hypoxanthine phosphoribosyltransferase [Coriobacteriales bacterium]